MNTPTLETQRLLLRKFTAADLDALYEIFRDEEVNTFLPWLPLKSLDDARDFYEARYARAYRLPCAYRYAICLKAENIPIGYIHVASDDSHDLGYGLRREFWHRGIATEAGRAVIEQVRRDGIPYLTATHDVRNPRSGRVMQRLGMRYQYSYESSGSPKTGWSCSGCTSWILTERRAGSFGGIGSGPPCTLWNQAPDPLASSQKQAAETVSPPPVFACLLREDPLTGRPSSGPWPQPCCGTRPP